MEQFQYTVLCVAFLSFLLIHVTSDSVEEDLKTTTIQYDYTDDADETTQSEIEEADNEDIRSESCKCGEAGEPFSILNLNKKVKAVPDVDHLIIGGNAAGENEFPWMAVIVKKRFFDNKHKIICGGSVISSRFILTAAHCIKSQFPSQLEIWLRAHNSSDVGSDNKRLIKLKVRRLIHHPKWDVETVANDIGLIELTTPILFESQKLNPVCLPDKNEGDFGSENGTVVGFGYTKPTGFMANILQKLTVPILSHEECTKTKYGEIISSNPAFLCAGFEEGGKDACTNDSGGPLTVVKNGKHKLVGIVSWGHGCAQPLLPGVYTRVTKYIDWINEFVKPKTRCYT